MVTHLIVHHAAGANTSTNWGAVVKSIWDYHVNTNGWADIGYNWLIAPDGKMYEGRGDNVQGAHFCGTNGNTMGVCMLGNLDTAEPTELALNQLKSVLSWKSCQSTINPIDTVFHANSGLTLATISGHQDGCATDCPGSNMYPLLPMLRLQIDSIITACGSQVSVPNVAKNWLQTAQISPNPTNDVCQLTGFCEKNSKVKYWLTDNIGRQVLATQNEQISGDFSIKMNISALVAGHYLLILQDENGNRKTFAIEKIK
jgi:hypothetical protein